MSLLSLRMYERTKRVFDLLAASILIVLLSPLMAFIGLAIWVSSGKPILFRQVRPGRHGVSFELLKFRTMEDHVSPGTSEFDRLTRFGKLLRRSSLDELPELINVLRGEMSLVGPRPLLSEYLPYYSPEEQLRHAVPPGITGWAQVHGRNSLSWDHRLAMDVWYVRNRSMLLDLRILILTIAAVAAARGVQVDPRAAMPDLHIERRSWLNTH